MSWCVCCWLNWFYCWLLTTIIMILLHDRSEFILPCLSYRTKHKDCISQDFHFNKYTWHHQRFVALIYYCKTYKVLPYSLGPELIPVYRQSARMWLLKSSPAVGYRYFQPGLQSPSQPENITILWQVPSYTSWWQRYMSMNNLPKVVTQLCPSLFSEQFTFNAFILHTQRLPVPHIHRQHTNVCSIYLFI